MSDYPKFWLWNEFLQSAFIIQLLIYRTCQVRKLWKFEFGFTLFILEYFNIKKNKHFLIVPSILSRYSSTPKTKRNFSNAIMPFWGLQYLTGNGHPSPFWKAIYGRTLISAGSNTEHTVTWSFTLFFFTESHWQPIQTEPCLAKDQKFAVWS